MAADKDTKPLPYSGENPHTPGTPAWDGWETLKKSVKADIAKGMDITKPPKM